MYKRLITFLEKPNILNENQFGFRTTCSTTKAILLIVDKIQKTIEGKNICCGLFLDLIKLLITVEHNIVFKKLEYQCVRRMPNDWLRSYLSNRKQFVTTWSSSSTQQPTTCGVPQGSAPGTLLFLLYISDFNKASSTRLNLYLFTDDSNLFFSHKSLNSWKDRGVTGDNLLIQIKPILSYFIPIKNAFIYRLVFTWSEW